MAERRLSVEDQKRKLRDNMQELTERKICDARTIQVSHPEGAAKMTDEMLKNPSRVRDQSQQQIEEGREKARQRARDSQEHMERLKRQRGLS